MNQEVLEKLSTLLLAEGTVRIRKKDASVVFTNTSEKLRKIFRKLARKLGKNTSKKGEKQVVFYSRKIAKKLQRMCRSFRTKPCTSGRKNSCPKHQNRSEKSPSCYECRPILYKKKQYPPETFPNTILNSNPKNIAKYLKLFCSCDGGPVLASDPRNDEIIVRISHPVLRAQIRLMFKKTGIETKIRGTSLVYIRKRREIWKFYSRVRFVKGVKTTRGVHKGIEKNKLLAQIIDRHVSCKPPVSPSEWGFDEAYL